MLVENYSQYPALATCNTVGRCNFSRPSAAEMINRIWAGGQPVCSRASGRRRQALATGASCRQADVPGVQYATSYWPVTQPGHLYPQARMHLAT